MNQVLCIITQEMTNLQMLDSLNLAQFGLLYVSLGNVYLTLIIPQS